MEVLFRKHSFVHNSFEPQVLESEKNRSVQK